MTGDDYLEAREIQKELIKLNGEKGLCGEALKILEENPEFENFLVPVKMLSANFRANAKMAKKFVTDAMQETEEIIKELEKKFSEL